MRSHAQRCIRTYILTHTYITCLHIHIHAQRQTYLHTYIRTYQHAYIHAHIQILNTYITRNPHMHTYMHAQIRTYATCVPSLLTTRADLVFALNMRDNCVAVLHN